MTARPRYAVYYAPAPDDPLWRFGSAVIGRDAARGDAVEAPPLGFDPGTWASWTAEPRRYGFHATLKPPFRLAAGLTEPDLVAAAAVFAAARPAFTIDGLRVAAIGSFLGLVPTGPEPELDRLAADCVIAFDRFRAPAEAEETAKRLAAPLSDRQRVQLDRWGYPYVFEDFRFHMTLTGRLPNDRREAVATALTEAFGALGGPRAVDAITLFRQAAPDAPFDVLARFDFGAT